jgi:hypothetical protein
MEVKTGLAQRFEPRRPVERRQANQGAAVQIGTYAGTLAGLEQLSQSTVPKASDHCPIVNRHRQMSIDGLQAGRQHRSLAAPRARMKLASEMATCSPSQCD